MEVDRMKEYWKTIGSGFAVTIFLLLIVSTPWLTIRSDRVQQIRIQAAYLAELSGYEGEEKNPMRQSRIVQELVNITRWKNETNTDDIEDCLYTWFRLMENANSYDPGSYIVTLIKKTPGAIIESLKGNTVYAQQLEEKWIQTRNISFYPFGLTLMLIFLVGMTITIVAAAPLEE